MNKVAKLFVEKASQKKLVASGILFSIIFFLINGSFVGVGKLLKITGGVNILDFSFGYSVSRAYDILMRMGVEGRSYYLTYILPMDFIFPILGGLFYFMVISFLLKLIPIKYDTYYNLILIPLAGTFCDITENLCIILMLLNYPGKLSMLCNFSSTFTICKFVFTSLSMVTIAVLIIIYVIKKMKTEKC